MHAHAACGGGWCIRRWRLLRVHGAGAYAPYFMDQDLRENRLRTDLAALEALRAQSTILQFETSEPADRYTITFRGKGLARSAAGSDISIVELHQVDLRLPFSYPQRPPDIRWLTPILHPNISFSG